jgi:hypothetical protein
MTHTLHRRGNDLELLAQDYVILCMPSKNINHEGSGPKLRRFFELALENGAIKIGDCRKGNEYHQDGVSGVLANVEDMAVIHAVFKDVTFLSAALTALKKEDLGLSIVVSGLFDKVHECCREIGLEKHTVNQSLGRWGATHLLPDNEVLELNLMCGHGMVAQSLIEEMVTEVKEGGLSPEEGAEKLFKPCMCGIFNPHRATELLRRLAQ